MNKNFMKRREVMSVKVEINCDEKLSVEEVAILKNLRYGVADHNYVLRMNETGDFTILYDENCIGRGIELFYEDTTLCLRLAIPTSGYEIQLFYELVESVCEKVKADYVIREEGIVPKNQIKKYITPDKEASLKAIKDLETSICNKEYFSMTIFGVFNPIDLGEKELKTIGGTLEGFEKFLHKLQVKDVFYAGPHYYQRADQSIFGVYFVGENITSIVPYKAHAPFQRMNEVDSYYVRIPDDNDIPYEYFIKYVNKIEEYDASHCIVSLDAKTIDYLSQNYTVNMTTKERRKGVYFGRILDNGRNHLYKIKNMELEIDELASLNHLAVFLRWMAEHKLLSDRLLRDVPTIYDVVKDKSIDLRRFMIDEVTFSSMLKEYHFNEEGREFAQQFYRFNCDEGFPHCVDMHALSVLGEEKYNCEEYKNEAYLFVPYNEEYYQGLSKHIDEAYKKFKK